MRSRITAVVVFLIAVAGGIAALAAPQAGAPVQLLAIKFDAEGTLYGADAKNNELVSYALPDKKGKALPVQVPDLGAQLAKALGAGPEDVVVHDLAVHPASFVVYLSAGKKGTPESRLFRVGADKKLQEVATGELKKAAAKLPEGTQPFDLAVTSKNVILSSSGRDKTFSSELHRVPLPLAEGKMANAQTELYHTSHKAWETKAPLVAMAAFTMGGKEYIVGATKCTPVVRIQEGAYKVPGAVLAEGSKVNDQAANRGGKNAESLAAWKNAKRAALLGPALAVAVFDEGGGKLSLSTLPLP
ncbi:MAG: hypothetical protein HY293_02915 [Planctomycetes bacterium]|nr:hypothetical protein [Planctomycetota bacterium]